MFLKSLIAVILVPTLAFSQVVISGPVTVSGQVTIGTGTVVTPPFQITAPTGEPSGVVGTSYSSTPCTTINGVAPVTYATNLTIAGLSFNTANCVYSGTPTSGAVGANNFTITATDSTPVTPKTATVNLTINITPSAVAGGGHNEDCNSSNQWTNSASKPVPGGNASAPQNCVYTALASTPSPGSTVTVTPGSCTSLNNAINNATAGQTIVIPALNGANIQDSFIGCRITPSAAGNATNWITVTTDQTAALPPEGTRLTPAWAGITSLPARPAYNQPAVPGIYIPVISTTNNWTVQFAATAAYWRFIGIEFTSEPTTNTSEIIQPTPGANHIIFDRVWIHGGHSPTGQSFNDVSAGLAINGESYVALIDSTITDTHCINACTQSHGVAMGGNSTIATGPIKITNNFIESAGENVFSGGAGVIPPTVILPSCDIELRLNHTWKPLFWKQNDPSYFGHRFEVDNDMELKNTCRLWAEGNIFDYTWGGQGSQQGNAVIFGPRNQSNLCCSGTVQSDGAGNLTATHQNGNNFSSLQVSQYCAIANHCQFNVNGVAYLTNTVIDGTHVTVSNSGGGGGTTWTQIATPATMIDSFDVKSNGHWFITDRNTGIWKSTDSGVTWNQINTGLPTGDCTGLGGTSNGICGWTINVNPHTGDLILNLAGNPSHFYRSSDETTWTQIPEPSGFSLTSRGSFSGPLMPPAGGGTMVLGGAGCTGCTTMYSTDDGTTTALSTFNPQVGNDESNSINGTVYSQGGENGGFHTSTDGAHTFITVWDCFSTPPIGPACNGVPASGEIYSSITDGNGNWILSTGQGVYRSGGPPNNPTSWTQLYHSSRRSRVVFRDSSGNYYFGQAQLPDGSNPTVVRSTDGGVTWPEFDTGIGKGLEAHKFVQSGNNLYTVVENGSTNTGALWTIATGTSTFPPAGSFNYTAYYPGLNPNAVNDDIIFINNAIHHAARSGVVALAASDGGDAPKELKRVYINNNGWDDINGFAWSISTNACCVWSTGFQITSFNNPPLPQLNINGLSIQHNTLVEFLTGSTPGLGPSFGFGQPVQGINNVLIADNISASGFGNGKTAEQLWTSWVPKAQLCFDHNFFAIATNPFGPNGLGTFKTGDNPPFPTAADSGACTFTATGSTRLADFNALQFTANNNGVNVNMQLLPGSPAHNAASDGTDAGVNWTALQNAIAGVY